MLISFDKSNMTRVYCCYLHPFLLTFTNYQTDVIIDPKNLINFYVLIFLLICLRQVNYTASYIILIFIFIVVLSHIILTHFFYFVL